MFKFISEKMMHKKWMMICLLIGNILMIAIAICNPMYYHSAKDKVLQEELQQNTISKGIDSGTVKLTIRSRMDKKTQLLDDKLNIDEMKTENEVKPYVENMFGIKAKAYTRLVLFPGSLVNINGKYDDSTLSLANLSNLPKFSEVATGKQFSNTVDNGVMECMISEQTMVQKNFMLGEIVDLTQTKDVKTGKPLKLKIVGVFAEKEGCEQYWSTSSSEYKTDLFISDQCLTYVMENVKFTERSDIYRRFDIILDSKQIKSKDTNAIQKSATNLNEILSVDAANRTSVSFLKIIETYNENTNRIQITMWILQVPVLILLLAFIFMVSKQMLNMEANEIAMMKSRGLSQGQLIRLYTMQSVILTGIGTIVGIPISFLLCRIIGASNSFMEFVDRDPLDIHFSPDILVYWLGAVLISISVMVLPVIKVSKVTIVEHKQKRKRKKVALWKKFFLDFIAIAVALYTYYNYNQQKDQLALKISNGDSVDVMLFLSSSFFIIGCGLLALRIMPKIVWIVYRIGKNKWNPSMYASFLQIIRDSDKQGFISVFLILTIAFGIYNATTAHTINQSGEENIRYTNGANLVLKEEWESNKPAVMRARTTGMEIPFIYQESDYQKFSELKNDVSSMTRVLENDYAGVELYKKDQSSNSAPKLDEEDMKFMAIKPDEFGKTVNLRDNLLDKHWYNYLNLLSKNPNGILVTKTYADETGAKVGDEIRIMLPDELKRYMEDAVKTQIVGIVDYWPTFQTKQLVGEEKKQKFKDNYMFIGNFDYFMTKLSKRPYSIYMKVKDKTDGVYTFLEKNKIKIKDFKDANNEVISMKNNPIYQVSNGLLTISFIVALLLCATGFLIYWILSIRSRELLFGVFRAMGLSKKELLKMLVNEHIFSTLLSIVFGIIVGLIGAKLFVPMMEMTYAPESQTLPLLVQSSVKDMVRLGVVVAGMVGLCLYILAKIIGKLKISQALKLGEE